MTIGELCYDFPANWAELSSMQRLAYHRKLTYRRMKARGLCPRCDRNVPPEGYITCQECRSYAISRYNNR